MSESTNKSVGRDQVATIINSVVSKVESQENVCRDTIFNELKSLQDVINDARAEVGASGMSAINSTYIPTATDELDAIVEATATATGTIMDACEQVENHSEPLGEPGQIITAEITKIYEACSFQDITGQRITKVVSTLREIEDRVGNLMKVISDAMPGVIDKTEGAATEKAADINDESTLLNGPQAAEQAVSQDDIDALLDDLFD